MDNYCECCGAEPDKLTLHTTNLLRLVYAHDEVTSQVSRRVLREAIAITLRNMSPVVTEGDNNVIPFRRPSA